MNLIEAMNLADNQVNLGISSKTIGNTFFVKESCLFEVATKENVTKVGTEFLVASDWEVINIESDEATNQTELSELMDKILEMLVLVQDNKLERKAYVTCQALTEACEEWFGEEYVCKTLTGKDLEEIKQEAEQDAMKMMRAILGLSLNEKTMKQELDKLFKNQ